MEKNANYALVGLSSLILFIGLVIFVVWLARLSFSHEYDLRHRLRGPGPRPEPGRRGPFQRHQSRRVTFIALDRTNPAGYRPAPG